jgi:hypothetical protein
MTTRERLAVEARKPWPPMVLAPPAVPPLDAAHRAGRGSSDWRQRSGVAGPSRAAVPGSRFQRCVAATARVRVGDEIGVRSAFPRLVLRMVQG